MILAYAAGVAGCKFVYVAHSEVAYAWGIENGVLDRLLEDMETAPVEARLKPLLAFVRKLMLTPSDMSQADADAVFEAGWDEHALHDAIAIAARRLSCSDSSKDTVSRRCRAKSQPNMPNDGWSVATSICIRHFGKQEVARRWLGASINSRGA